MAAFGPWLFLACIFENAGALAPLPKTGEEAFERHLEASGGREALLSHHNAVLKGRYVDPARKVEAPFVMRAATPDKNRTLFEVPGLGTIELGFDGKDGWQIDPIKGRWLKTKPEELLDLQRESDFYFDANYATYYLSLSVPEPMVWIGQPAYKVVASPKNGEPHIYYFDQRTGLRVGLDRMDYTEDEPKSVRAMFKDYKRFEEFLVATRIETKSDTGWWAMIFESIEVDVPSLGSLEMPDGIKKKQIRAGNQLSGAVILEGKRQRGAEVKLSVGDGGEELTTFTGDGGMFTFDVLRAERYQLTAAKGSALGAQKGHLADLDRRGVEIQLVPGGRLEGTVEAADGRPIKGAKVVPADTGCTVHGPLLTNDQGAFTFLIAVGKWRVRIEAEDQVSKPDVVEITQGEITKHKFVLRPTLRGSGPRSDP